MIFAFNLGALLLTAGLARNGLTQPAPSPFLNVLATFEDLITQVTDLTKATASLASGGGSLTQAMVCLTPVRFFPMPISIPYILGYIQWWAEFDCNDGRCYQFYPGM